MDVEKEPEMENAQAGASEKPDTILDPQEETHEGDPNGKEAGRKVPYGPTLLGSRWQYYVYK